MSKSLQSCLKYLSSTNFINLSQVSSKVKVKEFSSYGLLVRKNVDKCLSHFMQTLTVFPTFPANNLENVASVRHNIIPKHVKTYGIYFTSSKPLPTYQPRSDEEFVNIWEDQKPLLNLLLFCEESHSSNLYYSFQNYSYRWWRKLSPAPSAFQQSAIQEEGSKEESNTMNVTFSSSFTDNQPICLEKMQRIADENLLQKLSPENECKEIIHCSIYPDNSTFAYLVNGLVSPTNDDKIKEITFKETLAPYQVAVSLETSGDSVDLRMKEVANHLLRDLGSRGIDVFPFIYQSSKDWLDNYRSLDEIGVPYVASIKPDSLNTGVIYLRNKETKLYEEVHISQLKITLLLYLNMTSPLEVKSAIFTDALKDVQKEKG